MVSGRFYSAPSVSGLAGVDLYRNSFFFYFFHQPSFQVTIRNTGSYQLIFEGMVGNGVAGDIAIDDVTLLNGTCQPIGSCDFENVRI